MKPIVYTDWHYFNQRGNCDECGEKRALNCNGLCLKCQMAQIHDAKSDDEPVIENLDM